MSAWPWMKDADDAIADPISPVNSCDDRPSVKELIVEHRQIIDEVKAELEDDSLYDPTRHDDLWIVRFVLSHKKNVKKAAKAAKTTLAFRKEHNLDGHDLRRYHIGKESHIPVLPAIKTFLECCEDGALRFVLPDIQRSVVSYLIYSAFDYPKLVTELTDEEWLSAFAFITEWSHQWVDYVTRTTGRLTKTIRIIDLESIDWTRQINRVGLGRDGRALGTMEECYPQLLQTIFLVHPPSWIDAAWQIFQLIMPGIVIEKVDFIAPAKRPEDLAKLTKFVDPSHLPERYGGTNPMWPVDTPPPQK